jgi:hypothetical protein
MVLEKIPTFSEVQTWANNNFVDAPLGRISRVNANLSLEVSDFSALDNWSATLETNAFASLTGRPRRLALSVESTSYGASRIMSDVLTTRDSLGKFKITFKDVSYTNTDMNDKVGIGLREDNTGDFIQGGSDAAIAYYHNGNDNDSFTTTNSTDVPTASISDIDWGSNHDITIEWDGIIASLLIDGVLESSLSHSVSADYRPVIENHRDGTGRRDTIEVGEVIVEAL